MKCLCLLAVANGLLWTTSLAAQEQAKSKTAEIQARDAAVLETVLIDLLTQPDSPVEPWKEDNKAIHFSAQALKHEIKAEDVFHGVEKKRKKLSTDQLAGAREAAEHLTQRVRNKDQFKESVPKDKRIRMYSKEQAEKDNERAFSLDRPQVFCAYSPGYSRDQEVAVVHLSFGWSGNFHGAIGTYVLGKRKGGWTVLLRDLTYFV
jgi:hypothetical protein